MAGPDTDVPGSGAGTAEGAVAASQTAPEAAGSTEPPPGPKSPAREESKGLASTASASTRPHGAEETKPDAAQPGVSAPNKAPSGTLDPMPTTTVRPVSGHNVDEAAEMSATHRLRQQQADRLQHQAPRATLKARKRQVYDDHAEGAAVKIQSHYRGFAARKETSARVAEQNRDHDAHKSAAAASRARQAGGTTGSQTVAPTAATRHERKCRPARTLLGVRSRKHAFTATDTEEMERTVPGVLAEWDALWKSGRRRYVPVRPVAARNELTYTVGYRMRLAGIHIQAAGLTRLDQFASMAWNPDAPVKCVRAVATLYDGHSTSLFGSQVWSMPVNYSPRHLDNGVLKLDLDIFWHSQIADPAVSLLVQLTMAARDGRGALVDEYCIAWAKLDLAEELQRERLISAGPYKGCVTADLFEGSQSYLLIAETCYNDVIQADRASLPAPKKLAGATLIYAAATDPRMEDAAPYVRQDELLTYSDYVPGLVRRDAAARRTVDVRDYVTNGLAEEEGRVAAETQSVNVAEVAFFMRAEVYRALTGTLQLEDIRNMVTAAKEVEAALGHRDAIKRQQGPHAPILARDLPSPLDSSLPTSDRAPASPSDWRSGQYPSAALETREVRGFVGEQVYFCNANGATLSGTIMSIDPGDMESVRVYQVNVIGPNGSATTVPATAEMLRPRTVVADRSRARRRSIFGPFKRTKGSQPATPASDDADASSGRSKSPGFFRRWMRSGRSPSVTAKQGPLHALEVGQHVHYIDNGGQLRDAVLVTRMNDVDALVQYARPGDAVADLPRDALRERQGGDPPAPDAPVDEQRDLRPGSLAWLRAPHGSAAAWEPVVVLNPVRMVFADDGSSMLYSVRHVDPPTSDVVKLAALQPVPAGAVPLPSLHSERSRSMSLDPSRRAYPSGAVPPAHEGPPLTSGALASVHQPSAGLPAHAGVGASPAGASGPNQAPPAGEGLHSTGDAVWAYIANVGEKASWKAAHVERVNFEGTVTYDVVCDDQDLRTEQCKRSHVIARQLGTEPPSEPPQAGQDDTGADQASEAPGSSGRGWRIPFGRGKSPAPATPKTPSGDSSARSKSPGFFGALRGKGQGGAAADSDTGPAAQNAEASAQLSEQQQQQQQGVADGSARARSKSPGFFSGFRRGKGGQGDANAPKNGSARPDAPGTAPAGEKGQGGGNRRGWFGRGGAPSDQPGVVAPPTQPAPLTMPEDANQAVTAPARMQRDVPAPSHSASLPASSAAAGIGAPSLIPDIAHPSDPWAQRGVGASSGMPQNSNQAVTAPARLQYDRPAASPSATLPSSSAAAGINAPLPPANPWAPPGPAPHSGRPGPQPISAAGLQAPSGAAANIVSVSEPLDAAPGLGGTPGPPLGHLDNLGPMRPAARLAPITKPGFGPPGGHVSFASESKQPHEGAARGVAEGRAFDESTSSRGTQADMWVPRHCMEQSMHSESSAGSEWSERAPASSPTRFTTDHLRRGHFSEITPASPVRNTPDATSLWSAEPPARHCGSSRPYADSMRLSASLRNYADASARDPRTSTMRVASPVAEAMEASPQVADATASPLPIYDPLGASRPPNPKPGNAGALLKPSDKLSELFPHALPPSTFASPNASQHAKAAAAEKGGDLHVPAPNAPAQDIVTEKLTNQPNALRALQSSTGPPGTAMLATAPQTPVWAQQQSGYSTSAAAVPRMERFAMRVSVHNGLCIVGESVEFADVSTSFDQASGSVVVQAKDVATLSWVPEDKGVVLLVELMLVADGGKTMGALDDEDWARARRVAWFALAPWARVAEDGVVLNDHAGHARCELGPGADPCGYAMLSCRDMLADAALHLAPRDRAGIVHATAVLFDPESHKPPVTGTATLRAPPVARPVPPASLQRLTSRLATQLADAELAAADEENGKSGSDALRDAEQSTRAPETAADSDAVAKQQEPMRQLLTPKDLADRLADLQKSMKLSLSEAVESMKREISNQMRSMAPVPSPTPVASPVPPPVVVTSNSRPASPTPAPAPQSGAFRASVDPGLITNMAGDGHHVDAATHAGAPAHHPSTATLSPNETAQLYATGVLDQLPAPALTVPIQLELERADRRTISTVILQFLAFTPTSALNAPRALDCVYMRYQFFDFPPTQTPIYHLDRGVQPIQRNETANHMYVLRSTTDSPKALKYVVDGTRELAALRQVEPSGQFIEDPVKIVAERHLAFARYAAHRQLSVDVFDASSALLVGTCSIDLQGLLRQGREHAECVVKVDVVDPSQAHTISQDAPLPRSTVKRSERGGPTLLSRGQLRVRMFNVGRRHDLEALQAAMPPPQPRIDTQRRAIRSRPLLESGIDYVSELAPSFPRRRPGTGASASNGPPVAEVQTSAQSESSLAGPGGRGGGGAWQLPDAAALLEAIRAEEERKVLREARMRLLGVNSARPAPAQGGKISDADIDSRLLYDIAALRARHKRAQVRALLQLDTTRRHTLRVGYGELALLDSIEFQNPSATEAGEFRLRCSRPDVARAVTSSAEWLALCEATRRGTTDVAGHLPEDDLLADDILVLAPGASVVIPFAIQVFKGVDTEKLPLVDGPTQLNLPENAAFDAAMRVDIWLEARWRPEPILTHQLLVVLRRLVIDRTFRFYAPRTDILRETIDVRALPGAAATLLAAAVDLRKLEAVSSHASVVLTTGASVQARGERDRITIKAKSAARAAASETFYVTLYADGRIARPVETWQVNVHWLVMHDVTTTVGQTNLSSFVLRGYPHAARDVRLHCSHPDELLIDPARLRLPPSTQVEVQLHFQPRAVGSTKMVINMVEEGSARFLDAILVCAHARAPQISRVFQADLPLGSTVYKKVTYRNMYHQRRSFYLASSNPDLIKFTALELNIPALGRCNIGLVLNADKAAPGEHDVLVFINDEENRTEECYKVRMHVFDPSRE